MEQGWDELRELFGDEGVDEVEGLAEAERVAEIERQRQPPDNINPTKDPEMIDSFPEDISGRVQVEASKARSRALLGRVSLLCSCAWSRTCPIEVRD